MRQVTTAAMTVAIFALFAVGAQAQQQASALDGTYAGAMRLTTTTSQTGNAQQPCVETRPVNMTVESGRLTMVYTDWAGNTIHYRGAVAADGKVNAQHLNGDGSHSMMSGSIAGAAFTGSMERDHQMCQYRLSLTRSATTAATH
jgi:hypothetical protein